MGRYFRASVLLLLILTACGGGGSSTQTITGTLELVGNDTYVTAAGYPPCSGEGGFADITEGTQIAVRNGAGEVLAVGALSEGTPFSQERVCRFEFTITAVPADEAIYTITIGDRDGPLYPVADLEAAGWVIALTLGG